MALSVKKFINDLTCPEPSAQVNVMYHPTSSDVLCDGGGTPTAIFSNNGSNLPNIAAAAGGSGSGAGSGAYAAGSDVCPEGMDVVFVVDYTSGMGGAINGLKTGVSNLISNISSESGGNYRLGLVLFDGGGATYNSSNFYTSLPAGQKIIEGNSYVLITCAEQMEAVGNSSSFQTSLNAINTSDMPIGSQNEWGLRAVTEVVDNQFAGSFREGVQKLIVLITDQGPVNNALYTIGVVNSLEQEGIQVLYQTSQAANGDSRYNSIVQEPMPQGAATYGINFNSTWANNLSSQISTLCGNTFTYSCDEILNGWYMEPGASVAYNWNGSVWTSATCSYTVKVNLAKAAGQSANWNITPIPSDHPNYFDANTFIFTGNYTTSNSYGVDGTLTWTIQGATDYTVSDISNVSNSTQSGTASNFKTFTDNGVGDSDIHASLNSSEFVIAGPMVADEEHTITLSAKTDANSYNMKVVVIADEPDTLDADGNAQSPSGAIGITGTDPANFWLNAASSYTTKTGATQYTFSGVVGSSHDFELDLDPVPADYAIDVTGYTGTYSNTATQNAVSPNIVVNDTTVSGTFTMPSGGGVAEIFLAGQVNQPNYEFDLTVTDSIAGVSVVNADQTQSFTGYTGDTFVWAADLTAGTDTESFTINYGSTAANPATYVSIGSGAGAGHDVHGVVTMPASGGSSTVTVAGSSVATTYDMEITFTDDFSGDETYGGPITVSGTAGQLVTTTRTLSGTDSDITYSISTVTSDNTDVVVTKSGTTLTIKTTMPSGGGSAAVDVAGSSSVNSYSYTVRFEIPTKFQSLYYGWKNEADENIQTGVTYVDVPVSGNAGDVISIVAPVALVTVQDYQRVTPTTSSSLNSEITNEGGTNGSFTGGTNTIQHAYTPSCTLTMPSGGGSVTISTYMTTAVKSHSFSLVVSTSSGSSGVTATSPTCSTDPTGVSRGAIAAGAQTITFTGSTSATRNTIQVPVRPNNTADYDNEINSFTVAPASITGITTVVERNNYCGANVEYADIDFTMPSLDPRFGLTINSGTIVVNDTVTAISRSFTLNYTDSISNAAPARASDTFTGGVGTTHNYSIVYSASSGYTLALSGASDDSSAVTVARSGNTVSGVVTMPSGGGSATVTATGTSTQIKHTYTVTLSELISNAAIVGANADGIKTLTVDLAPGATHTFTEAISVTSGYYWSSGPTISDNQSHATSSVNSSGAISITVTGGSANRSAAVLVDGRTSVIQRTLTVKYRDASSGIAGANVTSGSGAGYTTYTQDSFTGAPGATGTKTLYYMPNSGYVSASINSIASSNTNLATGTAGSGANAGQAWTLNYTIPSSNTSVTVTVNGSGVSATQATAATTVATAATTAPTQATAATSATTQATKATIKPTLATEPTIAPTPATEATESPITYYYYTVQDCNGQTWIARADYSTPRFTMHQEGLTTPAVGPGPMMVTSGDLGIRDWQLTITGPSFGSCEEEPDGGGGEEPLDPEGPSERPR
jgi:hypothetical protein